MPNRPRYSSILTPIAILFLLTYQFTMHAADKVILPLAHLISPTNSSDAKPYLEAYFPPKTNSSRTAIIICPGGGYAKLAEHEGDHYARWLNEYGIVCFVLHYRLGNEGYRHPAMLQDGLTAIRFVRSKAEEWNLDPHKIGIMGSSAGGHLAAMVLTRFDSALTNTPSTLTSVSSRPDFGILCYPVITMKDPFAHRGSRENLLGPNPTPELIEQTSAELHVTSNTPPCFIWHTAEDNAVPVMNSLLFAEALHKAHVPFELHVYERGPHGIGLGSRDWQPEKRLPWTAACLQWLRSHGFIKDH